MRCQWDTFIKLLPVWMRESVDKQGRDALIELRLRLGLPPELQMQGGVKYLQRDVSTDDLTFCVNTASRYSPWTAGTISRCYITAPGGHRLGLCGKVAVSNHVVSTVHPITSICLRVARDFPGISKDTAMSPGSIMIIGRPGSGKTTYLRDLIRQISNNANESICVIDEKEEIFPMAQNQYCFDRGEHTDVLSGCCKSVGIETALRNLSPGTIAVDEITAEIDCEAVLHAGWCGVRLIATAHAGNRNDFFSRPIYRRIIDSQLFDTLVIMSPDKRWVAERMNK